MSRQKLSPVQDKAESEDAERWQQAITDAGQLYAETDCEKTRRALMRAIDWFKYRLRAGAPYPGLIAR